MWRARLSHLVKGVAIQYDNHAHSNGIKQYVVRHMPALKRLNPQLTLHFGTEPPRFNDEPVDLTNGEFTNVPHIVVQYDTSQKVASLVGMNPEQIDTLLRDLALEGLTQTTPPKFTMIDIIHAYHPPLPPYRPKIGPGWQYTEM